MTLVDKINSRSAQIGVIGMGYVGLPLVIEFCRAGFTVTGFDIDESKVSLLRAGKSYIRHIDAATIAPFLLSHASHTSAAAAPTSVIPASFDRLRMSGAGIRENAAQSPAFTPTTDFSLLAAMDCILICVPTPINKNREPDMRFVFDTARTIAEHLRKDQLVILESTTYPGTTDQDMRAILEQTGLKAGTDFQLAFSPEREDPNNHDFSMQTTPKVIGGFTPQCLAAAQALYGSICHTTVPVSFTRVAEATKLLENIYRSVNIALVNELKMLFDRMDIDIWEVIAAAKTKPFGFQAFYPGPGLGGHCIPIDPFYLTWKAREFEFNTRFIELAGEINTAMPDYVVMKVMKALNGHGKTVKGAKILLLGMAYKANVDDDRESPSYRLMDKLEELGAEVSYNDPYIPAIGLTREYAKFAGRRSVEVSGNFDLLLIATAHDQYKNIDFASFNVPVVDTRNLIPRVGGLIYRA